MYKKKKTASNIPNIQTQHPKHKTIHIHINSTIVECQTTPFLSILFFLGLRENINLKPIYTSHQYFILIFFLQRKMK